MRRGYVLLKKLIVMSLSALLLTGCGGTSEEETVHAPEYFKYNRGISVDR